MYQKKFHNGTDEISVWAQLGIQFPNGYLHEKGGLMAYSIGWSAGSFLMALWKLDVAFAASPASIEQIALRWMHIVAAIIWLGFLFFFVLAVAPTLKALDPAIRAKVFPELASRGLWWLRWSAVVTWLAGFRYFMILAQTDAINAGRPHAWGAWIGIWFACWVIAFGIEMVLVRTVGAPGRTFLAGALVFLAMAAASWLVVSLLAQPGVSNRTLSIAIGGGLGTILFFNVWGIAWRCQKRVIAWTRASVAQGTPMPPEAVKLSQMAT